MAQKRKDKPQTEKPVRLSAIDEDILTVLLGREFYGLEILDELNQGRPITLSFGSLYPALNRLEKKGLISWRWGMRWMTLVVLVASITRLQGWGPIPSVESSNIG